MDVVQLDMYKFGLQKHESVWNNFLNDHIKTSGAVIDTMSDTQFNIWLEQGLALHNGFDIPSNPNAIEFRTEEDAAIFIIKFS